MIECEVIKILLLNLKKKNFKTIFLKYNKYKIINKNK